MSAFALAQALQGRASGAMSIKIVILGATGVVGFHLVRKLRVRHDVSTVANRSKSADFRLDATDAKRLGALLRRLSPDVVVNAVKPPLSTDEMERERALAYKINTLLPASLSAMGSQMGFSLLHMSTDWLYEGMEGEVYTEESPTYPKNYYSYTKALAEERIAAAGGKWCVLRTEGVFGHDENGSNIFLRLKESGKSGAKVFAATDQFSQPIYAGELARLASVLVEKKKTGLYNAVGRDYLSRHEFAKLVCRRFGFGAKVVPFSVRGRPIQVPQHLRVSVKKIEKLAGRINGLESQFKELEALSGQHGKN